MIPQRSIYLSIYLSSYLFLFSIYPSIYLSTHLSIYLLVACQATSARSAFSLAIRKLGLMAHPSMDQCPVHLETKPTAPPWVVAAVVEVVSQHCIPNTEQAHAQHVQHVYDMCMCMCMCMWAA